MKLTQLSPPAGAKQNRKRAGRGYGSGRGKTCGKGMNGQKVRSGAKVGIGFEGGQTPLHRRLPKRRGVSKGAMNIGLFRQQFTEVNVGQLESLFESGATVTADSLAALKLSARKAAGVRILGNGQLTKPLTVVADHVTATARKKIESAGGTVEVN